MRFNLTEVPEEYVAQTGLGDLWRSIAGQVLDHMMAAQKQVPDLIFEHAGLVSRQLLILAAQVAVIGDATVAGDPLDADLFGEIASAYLSAKVDEQQRS